MKKNLIDLIGNTPLVYLKEASELTKCNIFGKAEFLNPGQSVKDRAALYIIQDAMRKKELDEGGIIVEGTAGNTGIGITLVANFYRIKTVIVIPKTQAPEKKDAIKQLGAKLIEVEAVPYSDPKNYVKYSANVAEQIRKESGKLTYWANQFDNTINKQAHIETTAEEIWEQTSGKVDGFICSVGSGGTLAGVSEGLKRKNSNIKIGLSDPYGSSLYSYIKTNTLAAEGSSITEGIGTSRITKNFENTKVDFAYRIDDTNALNIIFGLLKNEGLCLGTSSGINVAGAIEMAKEMGPGKTIVTILCDVGSRSASKIFNVDFLKSKNLPYPDWLV